MSERRRTAAVWDYFEKSRKYDKCANCNLCSKILSYKSTTTNLKTHLKLKHYSAYANLTGTKMEHRYLRMDDRSTTPPSPVSPTPSSPQLPSPKPQMNRQRLSSRTENRLATRTEKETITGHILEFEKERLELQKQQIEVENRKLELDERRLVIEEAKVKAFERIASALESRYFRE